MIAREHLKGAMTAMVTPFKDGKVDRKALENFVDFQISEGISCLVPCGTTGESATLSFKEHNEVVDIVVQRVRGRVPVIAGTGSNNTQEAVSLTRSAEKAGADGSLLITPYYNKPTPAGLVAHFKEIASASRLPLILYNIASRTGINMRPELIRELTQIPTVIAVKEASGDLDQMSRIIQLCGRELVLLSGDDTLTLPLLSIGGMGVISVVSNLVPARVTQLVQSWLEGNWETARNIHYQLLPLIHAVFLETNPIPVKTALGLMGKMKPDLRLPLVPMSSEHVEKLRGELNRFSLKEEIH
jgi:4-hydroxy-tetrahydrodipicolinate synthase